MMDKQSETTSAIGKANQTFLTFPVSESSQAAGIRATSCRQTEMINEKPGIPIPARLLYPQGENERR